MANGEESDLSVFDAYLWSQPRPQLFQQSAVMPGYTSHDLSSNRTVYYVLLGERL